MSVERQDTSTSCCASCGITECDGIKLVPCHNCDLVRYCGDDCQQIHKSEHEEECKKRAAELRDEILAKKLEQFKQLKQLQQLQQLSKSIDGLRDRWSNIKLEMILRDESRDEILFKQPENSHRGDCPICSLPMPLELEKSSMYMCCCKVICQGCCYANTTRDLDKMRSNTLQEMERWINNSCPFCRSTVPRAKSETDKQRRKRIQANDPVALRVEGRYHYGEGNRVKAFEYYTKAIELGDTEAHLKLAHFYLDGKEVEKDGVKIVYHLQEAAIGGHPGARSVLGCNEWNNGHKERAVKHWIIAATQGHDASIKELTKAFKEGYVEKEDLAAALRAHKAAVDATKSQQRKKGEEYYRKYNLR